MTSPLLDKRKSRARITTIALAFFISGVLGFMPIPSYTRGEGVVWLPDEALIKAEQDGFIREILVHSDQPVEHGKVVLVMSDDTLESKTRIARAKVSELQRQYRAVRESDLVKAAILKSELQVAQSELESLTTKMQALTIKAAGSGKLLLPEIDDLPGRYVHHGELIGYLLNNDQTPTLRMAVTQDNIGQLRERVADIKVRLANTPDQEYEATVIRLAPEATNKLPSLALSTLGGGKIQIDPNQSKEMLALQKIFLVDLKFNPEEIDIPIGTRAFVRINHGGEPLSVQWYRRIRQAFLRRFNV